MRADRLRAGAAGLLAAALWTAAWGGPHEAGESASEAADTAEATTTVSAPETIRVATFNVCELSTDKLEATAADGSGTDPQVRAAAEIVRRIDPDVLVLQEIDHDYRAPDDLAANARRFATAYLAEGGESAYPHVFAAPCNTGIASGHDLDGDGRASRPSDTGDRAYGGDSFGFGLYPGQYSMAVLSRFPIDAAAARTFQELLWRDLPGNHLPPGFYDEATLDVLRLSSKSHWDVPIRIGDGILHLWVSHPTPPIFDGDEDLNGRRNFDEIAFWVAYLEGSEALYDDRGERGGAAPGGAFVIAGDLNSDPRADNAFYEGRQSIELLLGHPRVRDTGDVCTGRGGVEHAGDDAGEWAARSTAVFDDGMRLDYLLPGRDLEVVDGGVFWPAEDVDPKGARLATEASDHRLVWIDLETASLR